MIKTPKFHLPLFISTPRIHKVLGFIFYLLVALIPLIFSLEFQSIFTLPKLACLQLLTLLAGIVFLYKVFITDQIVFKWQRNFLFLIPWAISLIISSIFTINSYSSLFGQYGRFMGLFSMLNFVLIPIFILQVFEPRHLRRLFKFSLIIAGLVSLYGLYQYWGAENSNIFWTQSPQERVFSTIGHANHLGAYLASFLAMLLSSIIWQIKGFFFPPTTPTSKNTRIIYLILSILLGVLLFLVLILTASRGALVAFLSTLLILGIILVIRFRTSIFKHWPRLLAVLSLVLILSATTAYFSWKNLESLGLFQRTEVTVSTLNKGKIPDRLSFFYSALSMFQSHPLTGTGLSTFRDSYNQFRRADYYIDGPGNAQFITTPEAAHNEYANILATQGLLGLLTYLALIISILYLLIRHCLNDQLGENTVYYWSILAGILVFLFQTLFNFGEIVNYTFFYSLIGFSLILNQNSVRTKVILFQGISKIFFTIILLSVTVWVFFFFWLPEIRADYFYRRAQNAELLHRPGQTESNWLNAIKNAPGEYSLYQSLADYQFQAGTTSLSRNDKERYFKDAVTNYLRAIDLNGHYPSTYFNLALVYLELGKLTKLPAYLDLSKMYFQLSVEHSPNNPRFLYEFARKLHSEWDDREQSVKLLKQALEISPEYQEPQDYLNFLYQNHPELKK